MDGPMQLQPFKTGAGEVQHSLFVRGPLEHSCRHGSGSCLSSKAAANSYTSEKPLQFLPLPNSIKPCGVFSLGAWPSLCVLPGCKHLRTLTPSGINRVQIRIFESQKKDSNFQLPAATNNQKRHFVSINWMISKVPGRRGTQPGGGFPDLRRVHTLGRCYVHILRPKIIGKKGHGLQKISGNKKT